MSVIEGTNIPKTIYMCFKHKRIPPKVIGNWQRLNPDFRVFLFDDNDCIQFLMQYYGLQFVHIFKSIPDGAIKSDFWRVCVLYKLGGVYADVDIEPVEPISNFVEEGVHMLTCHSMWAPKFSGRGSDTMNPHFIAACPGSPILNKCINSYLKLLGQAKYDYWVWSITGIMAAALRDVTQGNNIIDKQSNITTDDGLKLQFLKEQGPGGGIIAGDSPLVGCYYNGREVFKNRYADYKYWNVRTENETKRRNATNVGIKGIGPLRRASITKWQSSNMRRF